MSVTFYCPGCKQRYSASERMAGMTSPCKKCGMPLVVPSPAAAPTPLAQAGPPGLSDLLEEAAASQASLPPAPAQGAAPLAPLEAELGERRRRKKVREWSSRRTAITVVLILFGAIGLGVGFRERKLSLLAKAAPQKITLAQLAANGPGDNIWIDLTDAYLLLDQTVVKTEEWAGMTHRVYAWIPAVPRGVFGQPGPDRVRVVIGTRDADDAELQSLARQPVLRGIVVNATDTLGTEERKLLNDGLPGVDAGSCYFFRVGQGPTSTTWHLFLLGGSLVALLAGLTLGGSWLAGRILNRREDRFRQ